MKNRLPRGGFALGLVVGLLVGLSLALAVALYISKVPIPFVYKVPTRSAEQDAAEAAKNKDWDPNAPLAGKGAVRAAAAASGRVDASSKSSQAQPTSESGAAAASSPRAARDPAAILSGGPADAMTGKSTAAAPSAFVFYVQAGAYSRAEDAEQQRASVTMLGFEARVSEREQSGRTVYRVRIGPFDQREDAEAVQSRLVAAKIESNLVRAER